MTITKEAMITVCGRPNVGKSSLTNALVGEKIAIVSNKPQTTRNRIYGVVNSGDTQLVLMDTPGLHKAQNRLGDYMVKVVEESLSDIDAVMMLVEPIANVGKPEQMIIDRLQKSGEKAVLVINKIDTVKKEELLAVIRRIRKNMLLMRSFLYPHATHEGLDDLLNTLKTYAQDGPQLFPDDMTTDQPDQQVCAEIVREKILYCLQGSAAWCGDRGDKIQQRDDDIIDLDVTIYCEKASHKGILIGKGGEMLKKISSMAREDIGSLWVKRFICKPGSRSENWRDNLNYIRSFGYHGEN